MGANIACTLDGLQIIKVVQLWALCSLLGVFYCIGAITTAAVAAENEEMVSASVMCTRPIGTLAVLSAMVMMMLMLTKSVSNGCT